MEVNNGLYVLTVNPLKTKTSVINYLSFFSSVRENKSNFTKKEIEGANKARILYRHINMPGNNFFHHLVKNNYFRNSPVTPNDVENAMTIYGPDLSFLKGKSTRKRSKPIENIQVTDIPMAIHQNHTKIVVSVDYMIVQNIAMFIAIDESYQFRFLQSVHKRKANKNDILKSVNQLLNIYKVRNIEVKQINADNEFECIREEVRPSILNTVAAEEHVGLIERAIRTNKDDTRCHIHRLPYTHYPTSMVEGAQIHSIYRRNSLPAANGVSQTLSPETLITGLPPPDYNELIKLNFGDYVQTYEGETSSTNKSRHIGAIALFPSPSGHGSWYFMSLLTGKKIHRNSWTLLPATEDVIQRVNQLAKDQGQPPVDANFKYEWNAGEIVDYGNEGAEDASNEELEESNENVTMEVGDPVVIETENNNETEDEIEDNDQMNVFQNENDENEDVSEMNDEGTEIEGNDEVHAPLETENNDNLDQVVEENANTQESDVEGADGDNRMELRRGRRVDYASLHRTGTSHMQINGAKQFMKKVKRIDKELRKKRIVIKDMFKKVATVTMAHIKAASKHEQVSMKEGIRRYGESAIRAVLKEYAQLDNKRIFRAVKASALTIYQKREALNLLTLVKFKRNGTVKGRACADGRKQRMYVSKDDSTSPAVQLESILMSLMIDALERRDVATCDIVGAYLFAEMDEFVLIRLTGESVKIMCEINPTYNEYVTYEKGKPVLYLQLIKALYGCIRSALLWYRTLVDELFDQGFKLNPYDPCVANKMINGTQCTICWYVDDLKISHIDENVVSDVINKIEAKFGKMTVKRGKTHTFVGMDIEFTSKGTVSILMKEYIKECMDAYEEAGGEVKGRGNTPATDTLFILDEESEQLDENKSEVFHHIVSKLLYVSKRARIDIDLTISFLCTRVSKSTIQDWEKLRRLLVYLKNTKEMTRTIGADNLDVLHTWVDASYAIHEDMRSHTGGISSMGTGCVHHKSTKQQLNTKSSTESEVVGASDYLPWTIWLKMFLEAQGYKLTTCYYYQDNESAIRLIKNGKKSSRDKTRHIKIRYFFIADVIKRENLTVKACRSEHMVADYYTKPLQGKLFRKMRDKIMGLVPMMTEERVENDKNDVMKQRNAVNPGTNKIRLSTGSGSYVDAVKRNMSSTVT